MKAIRSNIKTSTKGGIVPILSLMRKKGIPQAIRKAFGKRPHWASYEYDDALISFMLAIICGKSRVDNITNLKSKLSLIPDLNIPSHDTIGRVLKGLATKTEESRNITNAREGVISFTHYCNNPKLNELLVKCSQNLGLFQEGYSHTLDIDATFISTRSKEARKGSGKKAAKHNYGHAPMVCLIGKLPVHVNLRSGNASPSFMITDALEECLNNLEKHNVKVGRVRSDAGGDGKQPLELLDSRGIKYIVRKKFHKKNMQLVNGILNSEWKPVMIKTTDNTWDCELADFPYTMFESTMKSRIVVLRVPDKKTKKLMETPEHSYLLDKGFDSVKDIEFPKLDDPKKKRQNDGWVNFQGYDYKFIITNDLTSHPKNLILEYNKRGGSERGFDYLKQCGWKITPFSKLNECAVYLIVTAIANNIFRASIKEFREHCPGMSENCTIVTFISLFIDVACSYLNGEYVFAKTDIAFEKIV